MICDVYCRGCGESFHSTNDKFDRELDPDGEHMTADMFVLKEPYVSYGWSDFPKDSWYTGNSLCCPSCETPYPDSEGRVKTVVKSVTCKVCWKEYVHPGSLKRHVEKEHS